MGTYPPVFDLGVSLDGQSRQSVLDKREQWESPPAFSAGVTLRFALAEHTPGLSDCTLAPVYPEARLSLVHHPDRGGETAKMQELNEARDLLLLCCAPGEGPAAN